MKHRFYITQLVFAILVLLALVNALPAFAQNDIVPENPGTIVTPDATEPVTPAPEPTPPVSSDPVIVLSMWQLVAGLATAFSLGGLTIGTGIGLLASRLRNNPATMAAIEGLAASTPDSTVVQISGLMDKFQYSLTEAFGLIREAFDNKAAAEKTPEEREAVLRPGPLEGVGTPTAKTGEFPGTANRNA